MNSGCEVGIRRIYGGDFVWGFLGMGPEYCGGEQGMGSGCGVGGSYLSLSMMPLSPAIVVGLPT